MSNSPLPFRFQAAGHDPVSLYVNALTPAGRKSMLLRIHQAARYFGYHDAYKLPWEKLQYKQMADYRNHLFARGLAPVSINHCLCAIAGVVRQCYKLGTMSAEDYNRIVSIERAKGESVPPGRALSEEEIERIFAACARERNRALGTRDAAALGILFGTGVRRIELAGLRRDDYTPGTGELRVKGKGRRERIVYVPEGATEAVAAWLQVRGDDPGPLFVAVSRWGKPYRGMIPMSHFSVHRMVKRRGAEAEVEHFTTHDCRRTFISDLLDKSADLFAVQQLAGHRDPKTTQKYDRRGERAKRAAAKLIKVPYKPPQVCIVPDTPREAPKSAEEPSEQDSEQVLL